MTIRIEPFLSGKWGWDEGESGWKEGVDENFLKFSYMLNKNVDGFVGTLPASPSNGTAYFLTTDNTLNARVDGAWYKYPVPKGFVVTEKVSGAKYEFNGSVFIATVSAVDKVKLDGIATGATVNSSDASLRDRATHTGTQATSTVTGLDAALITKAPLASPTFTGVVSAPTPSTVDDSTKVATTAFVKAQGYLTSASAGLVTSVASRTGDVVLAKADVGLPNVDNTADTAKPVSTAQQTALNLKANLDSPVFTTATTLPSATTIGSVSAAEVSTLVGVSSGIQSQLNSKAASSHSHSDATTSVSGFMSGADKTKLNGIATGATVNSSDATLLARSNHTGTQPVGTITGLGSLATLSTAPIANGGTGATDAATARSNLGLGSVDNTSDLSKPVSTATQTALNGKQASLGYTPINKAGDSGVGALSAASLTSTGGVFASGSQGFSSSTFVINARNPIWRFANSDGYGLSYFQATAGLSGQDTIGIHFGATTAATSQFTFRSDGVFAASTSITSYTVNAGGGGFVGDGYFVTGINASNISTGTMADARLSSNVALVSNVVTKATPSQLFQSLGTVNGAVTVNGTNGTHILATVNGSTTWTFPTPSATEAMALTLELTNGGAYTMTWPSGTRWSGGVAPTLTASGTDIIVFTKAGTNAWRGYLSSKDSK